MSKCYACVTPFHDDPSPSEMSLRKSLRLPSRGKRCDHRLCKSCVYTYHISALDKDQHQLQRRRRRGGQHHFDCPVCKSQNSFYGKRPIVDYELVYALKGTKGFREELVKIYQTPWSVPVGVYAHVLQRVGRSGDDPRETISFRHELIQDILQGLVQVHDPSSSVLDGID